MAKIDTVMSEFYDVLYKLRYPEITKAESQSIGSIIFTGENRIHLLSWLLTEKIPHIAPVLAKLKGSALQGKLAKYYSHLGICINEDILLGNCTLNEQLPTLILLLEFIKNTFIDITDIPNNEEESVANLLKLHFTENTNNSGNVTSKLSYSEAINYFEDLKRLDKPNKQSETSIIEELSSDNIGPNSVEQKGNFILQIDKFIDAYESVPCWLVSDAKIKNTTENSINTDVRNIYSDFMVLKQVLHMKDEISQLVIPQEPQKRHTPLNSVVEDIVICTDENICTMYIE
ncbi:hypothetical protein KPH14_006475 [Odynerus spinipes]|uniref:Uncharacterized protein n=1 Tax=Odynerus spinipes TaxID=1348599 RepID=A0AAD9RQH7_9HYME|nr:hypothetical protein KPH14_006475 [Odynerus spinipes]